MEFSLFESTATDEVVELFTRVFSASEGAAEGQSIGFLVSSLITTTPADSLIGCVAKDGTRIVGAIFFSRLKVPSGQRAFLLSPVAVATEVHGTGIGQALITFGLDQLRSQGTDLVFTYGDPAFYSKTGFAQIDESIVAAPYPLSQPIGWLGQSLDGSPIPAMRGVTECVEAFANPDHW
ncbi:GNAT family N-acetyltransferase [Microbulbifer agarilyticus]|uniref:GNAT family N-acetyltransferase n=1 Tax=Microbulbifer agarilyticus TaxID=260552 RepID=A0A1Q2M6H0_9GAMM|nr:N-acetyltransferase [Microbulbifer agarilyticus]AQQ68249.1 GNAT family N-acetyltransferase [Microbulbifer agarilyticus]